jgi:hypothetical protein
MPEKTRHVLDHLPQHAAAMRERMIVDREFRSLRAYAITAQHAFLAGDQR